MHKGFPAEKFMHAHDPSAPVMASAALSCIFLQYEAPVSSYGLILLCALAICLGLHRGMSYRFDSALFFFSIALMLQEIAAVVFFGMNPLTCISCIVNIWLIFVACSVGKNVTRDSKCDFFYLSYRFVGLTSACVVLVQFALQAIFGIAPLPIVLLPQEDLSNWVSSSNATLIRPSSFFSEPQVYCSYLMPLLAIALQKRQYGSALFLTASFAASGSSLGIGLATLVWGLQLFTKKVELKKKLAIAFVFVAFVLIFLFGEPFAVYREKIASLVSNFSDYSNAHMTSNFSYTNYLRLAKGWDTYFSLPSEAQLFGVGMTNALPYIAQNGISMPWFSVWSVRDTSAPYFSSASGALIECGSLLGLFYLFLLCHLFKKGNETQRIVIILLVAQSFLTQIFFNSLFAFYLLAYYFFSNNDRLKTDKGFIRERARAHD